jgi:hypothetical protein
VRFGAAFRAATTKRTCFSCSSGARWRSSCLRGGTCRQSAEVPARAEELANLIAFIATCGPYAPRDGLRIYARIAADYSAYNARVAGPIRAAPIVATVPHDKRALRCACPRIPDIHRAIATASLLAYNLDEFVDDPKAMAAAHHLVLSVLLAVRRCLPGADS